MTVEVLRFGDRAAWAQLREKDVTSTDVPALAGVSPFRSAFRVYAEKLGWLSGDRTDTNIMWRGRLLEPAVLEAVREREPDWTVRPTGVYVRDPEVRLGATPDGVAVDPARPGIGNVECKVVSRPSFVSGWLRDGEPVPPLDYHLQVLTQAALMDTQWSVLAALVLDAYSAELVICRIDRHEGAESRIRGLAADFWRNLREGRIPPPDYGRDRRTIEQLYPRPERKEVDLTGDNRLPAVLEERAALLASKKEIEDRLLELDTEVKHKIGDAEEGRLDGWRLSWRVQERKAYEVKATSFRKLTVRKLGDQP